VREAHNAHWLTCARLHLHTKTWGTGRARDGKEGKARKFVTLTRGGVLLRVCVCVCAQEGREEGFG